ncbi:unnamed protein product [Effrenium voratum]|uniref:Carrier domain-containing protein n=1 Tax=Effrenium voratum TaxID=2562239 RepID=A0AA36HNX9_9DINO|nr:unnamed protein product [Effrenium voratum]
MGSQESCLGECCRRLRMRFHRFEGEILPTDPPDFTSAAYWLAHPVHHPGRIAENLPKLAYTIQSDGSVRQEPIDSEFSDSATQAPADLFYLHGTMEGLGNRASIGRYEKEVWQGFNTRHQMTIVTAFTSACKAYAPLYRQAAMGGSWDLAYQDVLSAFEHFLSETGERPIVLAGHSQGSLHILRLVKERIAPDQTLLKRLVAVHAPGMGQWIEPSPLLIDKEPASAEKQSVAIWAAATPEANRKWTLIGFMSGGEGFSEFANPVAWSGASLGALLPDDNSKLPVLFRNFVQRAEVVEGLLRVHHHPAAADRMMTLHSGRQDLHPYDVHLFWGDVRERVQKQVMAYTKRQELAEKNLQQSREIEDKVAEAVALHTLLAVHLARRSVEQAIQCAKDAALLFQELKDSAGLARSWHLAGQLHLQLKDQSNAAKAVECMEAARDAQSDASVEDQATALQSLSAAHLANNNAKQALEAASLARDMCKEADPAVEAVCLLRVAGAYVRLGDFEAALSAASDAQELFREADDPLAEAGAAGLVARLQLERQDLSAALLAADTARALLRQTGELGREVGMLMLSAQVGSLELAAGAQPGGGKAARDFYEGRGRGKVLAKAKEAVSLSKRLNSNHFVAISRVAQSRAKVSNGLLEDAMTEIKEVLPILAGCGDSRAEGSAKLLQANISVLLGVPDMNSAKEALECFQAAGRPHEVAQVQAVMSRLRAKPAQAPAQAQAQAQAQAAQAQAQPALATQAKPATIDKMALPLPERVKYTLTELVAEAIGQEHMEEDRALMETGMTSIASIMLRDRIQAEFPEIPEMDLTFVFDYPTIREMTGFVLEQLPDA